MNFLDSKLEMIASSSILKTSAILIRFIPDPLKSHRSMIAKIDYRRAVSEALLFFLKDLHTDLENSKSTTYEYTAVKAEMSQERHSFSRNADTVLNSIG
jgi:hypothetical protein